MVLRYVLRAATGLAAGALLTACLLGVLLLGSFARIPVLPFTFFEWLVRVLPGRVVVFGLDSTLRLLEGLGFDIENTANTAEQVLAVTSFFVAGLVTGLLFFVLVRTGDDSRIKGYGLAVGGFFGVFSAVIALIRGVPTSAAGKAGFAVWVITLFLLWGWGIARLYSASFPASSAPLAEAGPETVPVTAAGSAESAGAAVDQSPQAEARAISRRRFIIQMGGLAATIVVVGAGVGAVLRAQATPETVAPDTAPIPFPNADARVQPAPGTRAEYTAVEDHFSVDIDLTPPQIYGAAWRLAVDGLVTTPLSLRLDQIESDFKTVDQFVTLSCISNLVGGPLIGTTLWTGVPLRDVLAKARPLAGARYAHIASADDFDEEVDLELVNSDPRIMLTYAWDGEPLTADHGFPLRLFIPDRYGMKQPKWITEITLTAESRPGYWVTRGWDERAEVETTTVIDTVAIKELVTRGGRTYVPIGGIAHSGAKGISKVEIQIDDAPWEAAELREPLSELTWVIWRYDWPFTEGRHQLAVRAFDGQGQPQETRDRVSGPSAATGLFKEYRDIPPLRP